MDAYDNRGARVVSSIHALNVCGPDKAALQGHAPRMSAQLHTWNERISYTTVCWRRTSKIMTMKRATRRCTIQCVGNTRINAWSEYSVKVQENRTKVDREYVYIGLC